MSSRFRKLVNSGGGSGAGVAGLTTANGGDAIADNEIIRGDGASGIQGSSVTLSDTDGTFAQTTANGSLIWKALGNGGFAWFLNGTQRVTIDDPAGSGRFSVNGSGCITGLAPSATTPSIEPSIGDLDTGIGLAAADQLSLIAGAVELVRLSEGVAGVSNGINTFLRVEPNVAGSGAPNVLTAAESYAVLTNEGATAENYHTLPTAAAGLQFTFIVQDTDGIRITASAADTIQAGTAAASAAAGFIRCATKGASITLVAINATEWMSKSISGTWTVDV